MTDSKAWNWIEETSKIWLTPSEDSYFISNRWKEKGFSDLLDFGCGLGRHSIFFAKEGFNVSAFDLSKEGINHLKQWAEDENLIINSAVADMLKLTLCSKDTWSFKDAGYPKVDENTIVKTEVGPEKGIPHFYVILHDILKLFKDFEIDRIRHIDDCYFEGKERNSKHYFILARYFKEI